MARHKDSVWILNETVTYNDCIVATLMDLRDELKHLNRLLDCPNFRELPHTLKKIEANTRKRRKK